MKHLAHVLLPIFWKFGGPGLVVLGILDSSFLFAPLGNDLLVVAMSARDHSVIRAVYYAGMSTVGSVLGVLLVDVIFRRIGEKGLHHYLSQSRIESVKRRIEARAFLGLAFASIAPPPFPFTAFVMAASALQYPRHRMLMITGIARMVRFTTLGVLALVFGRQILKWAQNDIVQGILIGLTILCVVGSVASAVVWIKRSRAAKRSSRRPSPEPAR